MINEIADKTDFCFDWINWILQIHDNIIIILIFILTEYTITMYDSKTREKRCVKYLFLTGSRSRIFVSPYVQMSGKKCALANYKLSRSVQEKLFLTILCVFTFSAALTFPLQFMYLYILTCSNKFIKNILCCFIADGMPHFMTIPLILPKMWITVIIFLITIHRLFQNNLLNTTYFANTRIFFLRPSSFLFQFWWFHGHYGCIHRWMSSFILIICTQLLTYQNYLIRSLLF